MFFSQQIYVCCFFSFYSFQNGETLETNLVYLTKSRQRGVQMRVTYHVGCSTGRVLFGNRHGITALRGGLRGEDAGDNVRC